MTHEIDWANAPAGATHYAAAEGVWYACFYKDDFKQVWVCDDESEQWYPQWPSLVKGRSVIPRPTSTEIPELKKLTQAVFEGLPKNIRFAAVGSNGKLWTCTDRMKTSMFDWLPVNLLSFRAIGGRDYDAIDWRNSLIERKESAQEVAQTIEAARVEERKHSHYFKDVSGVDQIDLYHVAKLYNITDHSLFHAFKKIACAGGRGAKDQAQDVQEAIDALKRWQELNV